MDLTIEGLTFGYPDRPRLLNGIDLVAPAGETTFLFGPSGCGKSTLLRCIAGLEPGYDGAVRLDRTMEGVPPHQRRIGLVFQDGALFPHLGVAGNVAYGLRRRPKGERAAAVQLWLERVGLSDRGRDPVDELSGGERQRIALARTLAARPSAVLLDEPLSALDGTLRRSLGADIKQLLAEAGVPVLWVTHDEAEATALADATWRMQGGRLVPKEH